LADPFGAWVRLHYVYPYPQRGRDHSFDGRLACVLPYLDVPLQHSHPDVLKRMKRPASGEREPGTHPAVAPSCAPELVVRSTFIAGFPGETEAEFEHLLDFMSVRRRSTGPGCFAYSARSAGAAANDIAWGMLPDPSCGKQRRARFMAVAEAVSAAAAAHDALAATMQVLGGLGAPGMGKKGGVGTELCRCAGD
jgi:ribosomal protein S12 methylthiotransferase